MSILKEEIIALQKERLAYQKAELIEKDIEIALLKQNPGRKPPKKKRMKPKHRQRIGHLKLIAVNGIPVNGDRGAND